MSNFFVVYFFKGIMIIEYLYVEFKFCRSLFDILLIFYICSFFFVVWNNNFFYWFNWLIFRSVFFEDVMVVFCGYLFGGFMLRKVIEAVGCFLFWFYLRVYVNFLGLFLKVNSFGVIVNVRRKCLF